MSKKTSERPVFPFTSIVGQEEICVLNNLRSKKFPLFKNKSWK